MVRPGAPGQPARTAPSTVPKHSEADTTFMQGMIGHHIQAIEMVALLKTRSQSEEMKLLGLKIEVSQTDEVKMMKGWLEAHGEEVPSEHAHHMAGATLMPGMLSPDDMARLGAARGSGFDKLFLEYMIKHHEGALTMVKTLLASPGAAQDVNIYQFAADVEADQSAEIERMRAMLASR
jgi:uncharacterized protein (DUF305 family)